MEEIKKTIYLGMGIFNIIKDMDISIGNVNLKVEDKEILCLYIGLLNTRLYNNKLSIFTNKLPMKDYIELYNKYYINIIDNINYEDINEYLNYILSFNIVKLYNQVNNIVLDNSNKILIKQII